ncbi:MAG TPA: hypothetical protein VFF80_08575 [Bacillota bacterium]|nr:hypothetical protein [Bacillota bacterium]
MMNCQDCREEISAALCLPEEQWSPEIQQHLAECAACRREFQWMQKAQAAIRDDQPAELPKNLHSSIMLAVAVGKLTLTEAKTETGSIEKLIAIKQKRKKNPWRLWTAAAVAAAAAIVMMVHSSGILIRPDNTSAEVGIADTKIADDSAAATGNPNQTEADPKEVSRMMLNPSAPQEPTACEPAAGSEAIDSEESTIATKAPTLPPTTLIAAPDEIYGLTTELPIGTADPVVRSLQIELDAALQEPLLAAAKSHALGYELLPATAEGFVIQLKIEGTGKELVELLRGIVIPDGYAASLPVFSLLPTVDSEKAADQTEISVYPIGSESVSLETETVYQLIFQFQVK